eukprot:365940-Chlamydomonas_euryale.AAC.11
MWRTALLHVVYVHCACSAQRLHAAHGACMQRTALGCSARHFHAAPLAPLACRAFSRPIRRHALCLYAMPLGVEEVFLRLRAWNGAPSRPYTSLNI